MLQNKFYTGVITYEGVEYEGQHEAIVDPSSSAASPRYSRPGTLPANVFASSYTSADELETAVEELYKTIQLALKRLPSSRRLEPRLTDDARRRSKNRGPWTANSPRSSQNNSKLMQTYYVILRLSRLESSKLSRLVCQPRSCSAKNG